MILRKQLLLLTACVLFLTSACSSYGIERLTQGTAKIEYDMDKGTASIYLDGVLLGTELTTEFEWNGKTVSSTEYSHRSSSTQPSISDEHGTGMVYSIEHRSKKLPVLIQRFYLYPDKSYLFTEIELLSDDIIKSNYMAPVIAKIPYKAGSKMLFVPFDNDKWVQYDVVPAGNNNSYEVTSLFVPESREGLVFGSVEHDNWKSAVQTALLCSDTLSLKCFAGVTSELTRDVLPHGKVTGKQIKSPKIMMGSFSDWRNGMETFAAANNAETPSRTWDKGTPFGWNSWGSIQTKINLRNAKEVSDFFKQNLQSNAFAGNEIYIGLDSYWDNFSDAEMKQFVDHCLEQGQKAGIYWAPFVDWARNPDRMVEGTKTPYKDVYLYANGKPQELDGAWAVDPTHPAVKKRIDTYTSRFKKAGFEYIKIDFLTHGSFEADKYADSTITTGMQAYNAGMKYFKEAIGDNFYITMAISPLFPSQYAHSRRIACDAFASIADTEYTLNGLSYGWWLSGCYAYNDSDHLVLHQKNESEGENRARITSGVMMGLLMLGDDLSLSGDPIAHGQVTKLFNVKDIVDVARIGKSFRPVYGDRPSPKKKSESLFMLDNKDAVYVASFNFGDDDQQQIIPLTSVGLKENVDYTVKELWSGKTEKTTNNITSTIPGKDVKIWKIETK